MKRKALFSIVFASSIVLSSTTVLADDISDLNEKKQEQQEKKSELQSDLKDVKKNMSSVETKINSLNKEIEVNLSDISVVESKMAKIQSNITKTEKNIKQAQKDLDAKKEILSKNLRIMYSRGKVSYLEFLFRSDSVSDFLYRFNSLEDLAEANEKLYDEIKDILKQLKEEKEKLISQKEALGIQKEKLDKMKKALEVRQGEQLSAMKKLETEKSHLDHAVEEQDAAINSINSQIADVIRKREEARRKAQEEARLRQQQQQQHNQSSGSGGSSGGNSGSGNYGNEISSSGQFALPMHAGTYYISSYFGLRIHPVTGVARGHNGWDFAAPLGTPIYAVDNGTVLFAGPANGYGHWVVVDHNNGYYSIYGHMYANGIYVHPGQVVTKGQQLAITGNDGTSTGAHLHLSLANGFNGSTFTYVDPGNFYK